MLLQPELRSLLSNRAFTEDEWKQVPTSIDGIPVVLQAPQAYIEGMGREWDAELGSLPFSALAHLARYIPHLRQGSEPMRSYLRMVLEQHLTDPVDLAIEAGCSVGADLPTLARVSKRVIGFDSYMTPLRIAHRYISGEEVILPLRDEGRGFSLDKDPIRTDALTNVSLVCGDALDPPFLPESADLVVAMNLLDNVTSPLNLLAQLDAILKPGGLLIVASPFNWNDAITPPNEQLAGSLDPVFEGLNSAQALIQIVEGRSRYHTHLNYSVVDERDLSWVIREHSRCRVEYTVFACALRKAS